MSIRTERVGEAIREILAEELVRLTDPGLGFVSITDVVVSPDLRSAVVFYSVLTNPASESAGASAAESTASALRRSRARLQSAIARGIRMKRTPVLEFKVDIGIVKGERMDAILRGLHGEGSAESREAESREES